MAAAYQLTSTNTIVQRMSDSAFIPFDQANRDYLDYLEWVAAGNMPDPYVIPASPVPQVISDRQFFQQLAVVGICTQQEALDAVKTGTVPSAMAAIVAQMPSDQQFGANMIISGATQFVRNHPMTVAIGTAYGWTSDQIDQFFIAASSL